MKIALSTLILSLIISISIPSSVLAQPNVPVTEEFFYQLVLTELQKLNVPADSEFANIKSVDDIKALSETEKTTLFQLTNPRSGGQVTAASVSSPASCFDYYTFGSVQVVMQPSVVGTVNGVPLTFTGTIQNNNPYPVIDGRVYVKIFHLTDDEGVNANGYPVVDQFYVTENVTLPANSKKPLEFTWQVPTYAESGEYEVSAFFVASERFNLLGLSFTDDVTGNKTNFSITSSEEKGVAFDKNAVLLNDKQYRFAAFPQRFSKDEPVEVSTTIVNPTATEQIFDVTWSLYNWAGERASNRLDQKNETITLSPKEERVLTYTAQKSTGAVSYVRVSAESNQVRSILNIRFVREGINEARLNFPGVVTYPLTAGQENKLFTCFHATSDTVVPQGRVTTTITDESGAVIHTAGYEGDIGGEMMAFAESFTPKETVANFTLTTTLTYNNQIIDEVVQVYRCQDIDPTLCPKAGEVNTEVSNGESAANSWYLVIGIMVLSLIILMLIFRRHLSTKEKTLEQTMYSLAFIMVLGASLLVGAHTTEAKSVNVNLGGQPRLYYYWNQNNPYPNQYTPGPGANGKNGYGGALAPNANVSINYSTVLVDNSSDLPIFDGAVVPIGTEIRVNSPHVDTDISWFGTGSSYDSPYGTWRAGAAEPPNYCGNYFVNTFSFDLNIDPGPSNVWLLYYDVYIPLSVNPPIKTITASPNVSCAGNICTVTGPGPITITNTFASTFGHYWYRYRGNGFAGNGCYPSMRMLASCASQSYYAPNDLWTCTGGAANYTLNVPARAISFNLSAAAASGAPTPPTIRGDAAMVAPAPVSGIVGTPATFHVQSTDPDGDSIRYGIDWDNNGSIDQWTPGAGYVGSGVSQPASRTWGTAGTYTIRAQAHDDAGSFSGWATHTITICALGEFWNGSACDTYPERLLVCPATATLTVGATQQFESHYWGSLATAPSCASGGYSVVTNSTNWSTMNGAVATVDNSGTKGLVTAIGAGTTNAVSSYSGITATAPVIVSVPPPTIQITANKPIVRKGEPVTLTWTLNPNPLTDGSCIVRGAGIATNGITASGNGIATNLQNFSTFLLRCTGSYGTVSDTETVEVVPSTEER